MAMHKIVLRLPFSLHETVSIYLNPNQSQVLQIEQMIFFLVTDNYNPARGPNLEGCECQYSPYGCCPGKKKLNVLSVVHENQLQHSRWPLFLVLVFFQ